MSRGQVFPSEMSTYIDKKSGREVIKLTENGVNWHLYFTENSFTMGKNEIYYLHRDKGLNEGTEINNMFKMDLDTGVRTQITEFEKDFKTVGSFTKTPDSEWIVFIGDGDLYSMKVETGEYTLLCRAPIGYSLGAPSISFDKRYVAVAANEMVADRLPKVDSKKLHENYTGFKEQFYAHKNSRLIIACMDGSGADVVFEDTHWMGHVQFAPDTNEFISYCHEGPWNYVQQRIWLFNTVTRHVKPCYIQAENDSIGHEFWTRDGLVFLDNRGRGHDGTITSDKTQAVTIDPEGEEDIPIVAFVDKDCRIVRSLELPYYCNHYHANSVNTLLVADAVEDIMLIDIAGEQPSIEVLAEHNTTWRWQTVHCHPCWSWEDDKILYASDGEKPGYPQLYMVKMK